MPKQNKKRILIVDDTPQNITVLKEALRADYAISAATSGAKAIGIVQSDNPPDLILLDVMMPEMDGFEVLVRLKEDEISGEIPVIFVTAMNEIVDETKGLELGAVDYISKPVSIPIVQQRVKNVLKMKEYRDHLEFLVQQRTIALRRTMAAFERFVPVRFLELLSTENITEVGLGDHIQRDMTILFSDIKGFTTLSENMTPEENFAFINTYLEWFDPIVQRYRGFIDKYIGDSVMALFSTAEGAVDAAIDILKILEIFNRRQLEIGRPSVEIGIGINTGPLMLGMVGSPGRMEGTVIGDAVNVASRIERLTRRFDTPLLISATTLSKIPNPDRYDIESVGAVDVRGKSEPVVVYKLLPSRLKQISGS
jgi:two-component system sensor histidine kinase ChiS